MEITPSEALQRDGVAPTIYRENIASSEMKNRSNSEILPLGKSPVNLAIAFDATKFNEGEHVMGFRLFFENVIAPERLSVFKGLKDWNYNVRRIQSESKGSTL
jgi:hypothetical protein